MHSARLLVYTRTTAYRHDSVPDAVAALRAQDGLTVEHTEDPAALEAPLDAYAAVVFLSTSGEVLTPDGRARLARYVEAGGGFVGVHAAACTEDDWPYYRDLLGARFTRHPALQPGTAVVGDAAHPATRHLPPRWDLTDEWYDFDAGAREAVRVLLSADESSYEGGGMGADHPLAWCHGHGAGRVFYTALGHTSQLWADPVFLAHVRGGIDWAAGAADGGGLGDGATQ
ncbi:ThuA domain-containing protein [Streptomyces sp. XM83C]|jgi:type 1 glutamine amidotransferase|uniref:ThuA domain-containing protein n=1 Tax=Streptomyces thermocoprophilus TaxID=78356 RepID=A0ABV5VC20_9ACTN|nr:ThuA domain-containing protein [Streptomyces sp. XM83C]MCK1822620.1 ThuA domain-containing protein [Streptomyces sp. XM83C]